MALLPRVLGMHTGHRLPCPSFIFESVLWVGKLDWLFGPRCQLRALLGQKVTKYDFQAAFCELGRLLQEAATGPDPFSC